MGVEKSRLFIMIQTQNDPGTSQQQGLDALSLNLLHGLHGLLDERVINSLRPEQVRALIPIAKGDTIASVAIAVGKGEKTIDRWLQQEGFKKAVTATVVAIYSYGLRGCAIGALEAVDLLRTAVKDKSLRMNDRIRAACVILEMGEKWNNLQLADRITELERQLAMRAGELLLDDEDLDDLEEDGE